MAQTEEFRFDPGVGKINWRREWLPTPVFLPGQRSLVGYRAGHDVVTNTHTLCCIPKYELI